MRTTKWMLVVAVLLLATACKPESLSGLGGVAHLPGGGGGACDSCATQPTQR